MIRKPRNEPDFAVHVTKFFSDYLPNQAGFRENTILSYRDTFFIFLPFLSDEKKLVPEKLSISDFNRTLIIDFLEYLRIERKNGDSTRNQRLATIHSFFKFVMYEAPVHAAVCQDVLTVDFIKTADKTVNFLTTDGIQAIFEQPDITTKNGRRDLVLLTTLYDTAARVSELVTITAGDLQLESFPTIKVTGKAGKIRSMIINPQTAELLKQYLKERLLTGVEHRSRPIFCNKSTDSLTRAGISHILKKYADKAREKYPTLIPDKISPHVIRHSKAMHLLQAGVNIVYIRDVLGNVSITTTEIYAKSDSAAKRNAIDKAYKNMAKPLSANMRKDPKLIDWLKSLG